MKKQLSLIVLVFISIGLYLYIKPPAEENVQVAAQSLEITESINQIEIDLQVADLIIESGPQDSLQVDLPELRGDLAKGLEVNVEVEGQTLKIETLEKRTFLNWNWGDFTQDLQPVRISLPEGVDLDQLKLSLDMGSAQLNKLTSQELTATLDMGSLYIKNGEFRHADFKLSMGSVQLDHTVIFNSKMDIDMGSLEGIAALLGQHEIDLSMGGVDLGLLQSKANTEIVSDVDMGSLDVLTNLKERISPRVEDMDGKAHLDIDVDMGGIDLNFVN